MGLRWSDLTAGGKLNKKAIRDAERQRAKEDRERKKKRWEYHRILGLRDYWRTRRNELGKRLMLAPWSDRLNSLFLSALDKARTLDHTAVDLLCRTYGFKADYFVVED